LVVKDAAVVDLTGRTTLAEAAELIAGARAVIAIDNGLAHVAAALGVPTVVLFGATSETKNRPLGPRVRLMTRPLPCRPCQMTPRWDACRRWRCMGFSVDEVAAASTGMMRG
jgi:heptosyltransferase-2